MVFSKDVPLFSDASRIGRKEVEAKVRIVKFVFVLLFFILGHIVLLILFEIFAKR